MTDDDGDGCDWLGIGRPKQAPNGAPPVSGNNGLVDQMTVMMEEAKSADGKVPAAPLGEPANDCRTRAKKVAFQVLAVLVLLAALVAAVHYLANMGAKPPIPTMPTITAPAASAVNAAAAHAARQPKGVDYSGCRWWELEATPDGRQFWTTVPCARFIY
jgi:hypothetical protein